MKRIGLNKQAEVLQMLKNGGLVVFPTDTVYGLLADATNEKAVRKLIQFKNRPFGKPISVFVSEDMLEDHVKLDEQQKKRLGVLLPGPFTIILNSKHKVSELLEFRGTLGVRVPDYKPVNDLVVEFGRPLTATSANISGKAPHHSAESFLKQLSDKKRKLIDLIVDAGKLPRNKPSTIVDLISPTIKILRHGDMEFSEAEIFNSKSPEETKKIAQQLQKKHFKKNKPLIFILQGDLGVGKTIFVKGIGDMLGVENIISPTFVIYYDYDVKKKDVKKLIHVDLYNLVDQEEFKYLGLEKYLVAGNILAFEWGEKAGPLINQLRKKGNVVLVRMNYIDEKTRQIKVGKLQK